MTGNRKKKLGVSQRKDVDDELDDGDDDQTMTEYPRCTGSRAHVCQDSQGEIKCGISVPHGRIVNGDKIYT